MKVHEIRKLLENANPDAVVGYGTEDYWFCEINFISTQLVSNQFETVFRCDNVEPEKANRIELS